MKSAKLLNEKPPFLKGLSVPEVMLYTGMMTVMGLIAGIILSIALQSLTPVLIGFVAGVAAILWLPKQLANRIIRWRSGNPVGWLYQRIHYAFYPRQYISLSGVYHNKKDNTHV
ncbi:DUF3487 family protein [Shewanella colwelliana]|uniref:DUF3487 family protein n=1 Tax=Shewanella colwelliana TaxID=23 RepID=UPI00373634E1